MSETRPTTIAGVPIEPEIHNGITYIYPRKRLDPKHIALSLELSSSHASGRIGPIPPNPSKYHAQGAYIMEGNAKPAEFVAGMANLVDPRFDDLAKRVLQNRQKVETLRRIGEHLKAGGNIVYSVPHGPLLDIGLLHAMAYVGLGRLGYEVNQDFRAGIDISRGVTGLAADFDGDEVTLTDALSWACNKIWFVTPSSEKARGSRFSRLMSRDLLKQQNAVIREDVRQTFDQGGMLVTVALSATSYRIDERNTHWLIDPSLGTLKTFAGPRTRVAAVAGKILQSQKPAFDIAPELVPLHGSDEKLLQQGQEIMADTTWRMNAIDSDGIHYARQS